MKHLLDKEVIDFKHKKMVVRELESMIAKMESSGVDFINLKGHTTLFLKAIVSMLKPRGYDVRQHPEDDR